MILKSWIRCQLLNNTDREHKTLNKHITDGKTKLVRIPLHLQDRTNHTKEIEGKGHWEGTHKHTDLAILRSWKQCAQSCHICQMPLQWSPTDIELKCQCQRKHTIKQTQHEQGAIDGNYTDRTSKATWGCMDSAKWFTKVQAWVSTRDFRQECVLNSARRSPRECSIGPSKNKHNDSSANEWLGLEFWKKRTSGNIITQRHLYKIPFQTTICVIYNLSQNGS